MLFDCVFTGCVTECSLLNISVTRHKCYCKSAFSMAVLPVGLVMFVLCPNIRF